MDGQHLVVMSCFVLTGLFVVVHPRIWEFLGVESSIMTMDALKFSLVSRLWLNAMRVLFVSMCRFPLVTGRKLLLLVLIALTFMRITSLRLLLVCRLHVRFAGHSVAILLEIGVMIMLELGAMVKLLFTTPRVNIGLVMLLTGIHALSIGVSIPRTGLFTFCSDDMPALHLRDFHVVVLAVLVFS